MTETEALARMIPPGARRPGKYREGVIQIWVTRACDKACFNCTQGSNYGGKPEFITPVQFEQAVCSLSGPTPWWGVVGVFGGNPAMHPEFSLLCEILARHVPYEQRGLWCNHPRGKGRVMARTFNPAVSNLNVHLDREAYEEFRRDWPGSRPFGLTQDSRHAPVFVAMKDVVEDEGKRWELISDCDINKHWSAMIGVFRGQVRAWFCEVAGAQSMLHQDDPDYPDTGVDPTAEYHVLTGDKVVTQTADGPITTYLAKPHRWWQLGMQEFTEQVRKHCHECGVPLRGYGELACSKDGVEQASATHERVAVSKRKGREVEIVSSLQQLGVGRLRTGRFIDYVRNAT